MAIRFSCPTCNKALAVPDDKAGVKVACPGCKQPFRVPASGQAAAGDGHATKSASSAAVGTAIASGPKTSRGACTSHSLSEWGQVDAALGDAVEVLDRDLSKQEEAQVRASLTAYAEAVPHHDLRGLGKQVTITRVREFRTYRVVLDSLYERRQPARKEEPFQGGDVPPPTTTEENIQVWSYGYATATDFRKGTVEHRVGESQQVVVCKKCGGQTITECAACSASGFVTCSACGGSGRAGKCPQCRGKGEVKERRDVPPEWEICRACTGGVAVGGGVCSICNGTGMAKHHYYQERVIPCGSCSASGKAVCTSCGGNGRVRCPRCGGAGKTPCSTCRATGKTLSYLCVVQSFDVSTETISVPSSEIEAGTVTGMLQPSDHSAFLTLTTTDPPTGLTLASGPKQLRGAVTKACDTALARVSQESRLMRQRLQVGVASILEVGYQHDGKEYTAWFIGKQLRVYAPASPVTDALKQMVKKAVKTWRKGDSKDATLLLREVMDMAGADPHCNAAYEEVRDTIPADLESKAKWVRWKPFYHRGGRGLRHRLPHRPHRCRVRPFPGQVRGKQAGRRAALRRRRATRWATARLPTPRRSRAACRRPVLRPQRIGRQGRQSDRATPCPAGRAGRGRPDVESGGPAGADRAAAGGR
jgi:hypothetical protein